MNKISSLLLASTVAGAIALGGFSTIASAQSMGQGPGMQAPSGEQTQMRGPMGPGQGNERMMRGQRGGMQHGQQAGGQGLGRLLHFACASDAAGRMESGLDNLATRLALTAEQQPLFDAFKSGVLTAQTGYADDCSIPTAAERTEMDIIDRIRAQHESATLRLAAVDAVLPSLESLYDSLSDAQKASFMPATHGEHRGMGGRGRGDHDGGRNRGGNQHQHRR